MRSSEGLRSVVVSGAARMRADAGGMRNLAAEIYRACHLTGQFTLRSGRQTSFYFDKYQFEANPVLLSKVCIAMAPLVPADVEVLAGLELGGIPVVTELARITGLPAAFVRKRAKEHGTGRLAEGAELQDRRVLIVEDVVTSGGQIIRSTSDLRALGALVECALCVVDRGEGGAEALLGCGVELRSLFTAEALELAAG